VDADSEVTHHGPLHADTLGAGCCSYSTARQLDSIADCQAHCINESIGMHFATLNYINVHVKGLERPVHALIDGGSQVYVVSSKVIDSLDLICVGNVLIKGITGSPINCNLYKLHIALTPPDADKSNV
jgi:hypothetical protein